MIQLATLGATGLEVSPSKVWQDTKAVSPRQVAHYLKQVKSAGLEVVGIHSLFFDQPHMGLFRGSKILSETRDFLVHLSAICSDLGGKTIVFGSGPARMRGGISEEEADTRTIDFFHDLANRTESHGTCFVIEALGEDETDYISSLRHAGRLVDAVNRPQLQSHIDLKAAHQAEEIDRQSFMKTAPTLAHVHVNDPGLTILGSSGLIDHAKAGELLHLAEYDGYYSLEQCMLDPNDVMGPIEQSLEVLKEFYI